MPKRQKTLVSSLERERLYTGVCSTFSISQLTCFCQACSEQQQSKRVYQKLCMFGVVLCGIRETIFAATVDSYQFRTEVQVLPCLHFRGPGWIVRALWVPCSQWRIVLLGRFSEPAYKIKRQWQEKMNNKFTAGEKFNICESCCTPAALITVRADFTILSRL